MAVGKCTRKLPNGRVCHRITRDTRGTYLAIDGTARWMLLCKRCRGDLYVVLEQFTVGATGTPWLTAAPIEAPDETWWTPKEIREALSLFLGPSGRAKAGFLSEREMGLFRNLFRGAAKDIDEHAQPAVIDKLREQMDRNRAK